MGGSSARRASRGPRPARTCTSWTNGRPQEHISLSAAGRSFGLSHTWRRGSEARSAAAPHRGTSPHRSPAHLGPVPDAPLGAFSLEESEVHLVVGHGAPITEQETARPAALVAGTMADEALSAFFFAYTGVAAVLCALGVKFFIKRHLKAERIPFGLPVRRGPPPSPRPIHAASPRRIRGCGLRAHRRPLSRSWWRWRTSFSRSRQHRTIRPPSAA